MSNSLVLKSLKLSDESFAQGKVRKKKKSRGLFDLIPAHHRQENFLRKHSKKLTVSEAKKQLNLKPDPLEENIQKLLLLGSSRIDSEVADRLFERAVKKRYIHKEENPKEESTVFTEEDFKKFEAEYTGD